MREYNTLNLPRFCRELDRYKASNREGAKVGNALLKDLGVVNDKDQQFLLCPGKIMRQRMRHGKIAEEQHGQKPPPGLNENTILEIQNCLIQRGCISMARNATPW